MKKSSQVPCNDKQMAADISHALVMQGYDITSFNTWEDDGNVGVVFTLPEEKVYEAAKFLDGKFGHMRVGDGVQEGDIFISSLGDQVNGQINDVAMKADY